MHVLQTTLAISTVWPCPYLDESTAFLVATPPLIATSTPGLDTNLDSYAGA